nr:MAG TPA: YEATS family protein [Caudoviricetes sp.]
MRVRLPSSAPFRIVAKPPFSLVRVGVSGFSV